jgi:hypothetical protein
LNYPYPGSSAKAWDFGLMARHSNGSAGTHQFYENRVEALVGRKLSSKFFLELGSGYVNQKNKSSNNSFSFIKAHAKAEMQLEKLYGALKFLQDSNIADLNFPKTTNENLRKKEVQLDLLYVLGKWRLKLLERYGMLSDNNSRFYSDIDLKYAVFTEKVWLLVGVGADYYWNKYDRAGYWTPRTFKSYGVRIDANIPIKDRMSIFAGANLNRIKTETGASGTGFYSNLGFQFGKRDEGHIKLGYERIQSQQNSSIWYMDRPYLSGTYFW